MKFSIFLFILFLIPQYFYAWGKEGHMIIAKIAETKLNKSVKEKVQFYLSETTFEEASVWMDEMRSDHSYDYMKTWHYVNIEENETYVKAENGDIVSELKKVISELKNYKNLDKEEVSKYLKILFHLCGDITQPLHTGYGSDRGGNDVKIRYNKDRTNLHHIWDTYIIADGNISLDSCLQFLSKCSEKDKKAYAEIDVIKWMYDSRSLLFSAYNIRNKKIDEEYIRINKELVETQLIKGGLRLAAVLNEIFKEELK